jgi:hypothetical protein
MSRDVLSCTHWLRLHPATPHFPPIVGLVYEGAIGQQRKTTSLCNPLVTPISCSDSLYEEDEDLEDEGEDGGSSSYLDSSSGPPPPETNNNLRLTPGGSPAAPTPADKMTPTDLHHQADSSTERDPNDSEGKKIRRT